MIKDMMSIFPKRERWIGGLLILVGTGASFLDVIGIGLLYPYITILQNPNKVFNIKYLGDIYRLLGFESTQRFLYFVSVGLITLFCLKALISVIVSKWQASFVYSKQSELSGTLLDYYLTRPYSFFQSTNSATLIGNVTTSVNQVCSGAIFAGLGLFSELVVVIGLLVFLVVLSPLVFITVVALVGGTSAFIFLMIKSRVSRLGEEGDRSWKGMIRIANEAIGAAKEIKVLGVSKFFVDQFYLNAQRFVTVVTRNTIVTQLPRVLLETGAVVILLMISMVAVILGRTGESLFALLAVFAVATVRLVPSANRILQAWNSINYYAVAVHIVGSALSDARKVPIEALKLETKSLLLRRSISVNIKDFHYAGNPHFNLRNINFEVARGQTIAFIGQSGSGKSTLIDLILGLYSNFEGSIRVDGCEIRKDPQGWQRNIGYIPQSLYLRDDTIAHNVAFGVPDSQIDIAQIKRTIELAGLQHVIASQPNGLETIVGDRGIRLSGGERQRIGIARALYHDPDLLILDEATSALDNVTERQIVDSILALSPTKTIIVIAHRLSTVRRCDTLYLMSRGEIIDRGDFNSLQIKHPDLMQVDNAA